MTSVICKSSVQRTRKRGPKLKKNSRRMKLSARRKELPGKRPKKRQDFHPRPNSNSRERRTLKSKKMRVTISTRKKILQKLLSSTKLRLS